MIDITKIDEASLEGMINWMESPIAMEYFCPKLLESRSMFMSQLVNASEDNALANILRGKIQLVDSFLSLHDQLLAARQV